MVDCSILKGYYKSDIFFHVEYLKLSHQVSQLIFIASIMTLFANDYENATYFLVVHLVVESNLSFCCNCKLFWWLSVERPCASGVAVCDENAVCIDESNGEHRCECYPGYTKSDDGTDTCISEYRNVPIVSLLVVVYEDVGKD